LHDIVESAGLIREHLQGRSLEEFARSALVRDAVERRFAIVGEALTRALQLDRSLSARVTDAAQIVAFRNHLVHGHVDVDPQIV
jgi:uncharacterized protein with HEPN domain